MSEHVEDEVERIEEAADRVLASESMWSICTDWNLSGVPTATGKGWIVQTLTPLTSPRIAASAPTAARSSVTASGSRSSMRTDTTRWWRRSHLGS